MTVEKINGVQPSNVMKKPENKQPEKPTEQKTSKNSKHVIAALTALAVISAAGIAIYKHKNTKKITEETNTAIDEVKNKIKVEDFFGKEAKEGFKLIEKAEQEARRAKIKSHVANETWKKEQHRLKEQAYQELFDQHFEQIEKEAMPVVKKTIPAVVKTVEETLPAEYHGLSEIEKLFL